MVGTQPAAAFVQMQGFSVDGFDGENNASADGPIFLFQDSTALAVRGFTTIHSALTGTGSVLGVVNCPDALIQTSCS